MNAPVNARINVRRGVFQKPAPDSGGRQPHFSGPASALLALIGFVGLCLLVGLSGAGLTANAVRSWYPALTSPPLTPPNWLFAPVWTVLYVMIGAAAWLVWRRRGACGPLRLWGWQLAANALWTPAFFGLHSPALGMVIILAMLILAVRTALTFRMVSRLAAILMLPYLAWGTFAAYLNLGFLVLNHP